MRRPISGVKFAGILLTMVMMGTLFLALNVRTAKSSPATIIVPDDYSTIQAAIDNASAGDTVFVRAGTYNCTRIQIDKPLTLKGENNQNTTLRLLIPDFGSMIGIHIIASNVTISGFHLIGFSIVTSVMLIVVDGRGATADNCVIRDNVLEEYGTDALVLIGSHSDEVVGNVISSQDGSCMYILSSSNCLLKNNSLSGSEWTGIMLDWNSNNNTVTNNFITNQINWLRGDYYGAINLGTSSEDNTVIGNTLVNNQYGLTCEQYTQNNVIYHNNFVNNTHQVYDSAPSLSANFWDNGYPSGGNYWSDYSGNDSFSGPSQNVTGSDGIGDAPYVISAVSSDRYPLMNPWKNPVGDVNMDGKVDGKDIALVALAFGSVPGDPRWNALADVNGDQRIDGKDMTIVAIHFGKG